MSQSLLEAANVGNDLLQLDTAHGDLHLISGKCDLESAKVIMNGSCPSETNSSGGIIDSNMEHYSAE